MDGVDNSPRRCGFGMPGCRWGRRGMGGRGMGGGEMMRAGRMLAQGGALHFWRAVTDNDIGIGTDRQFAIWKGMSEQRKVSAIRLTPQTDGSRAVEVDYQLGDGAASFTSIYRMAGDVDYMLRVVVADMQAYDAFYKRLIARVELSDVTSMFAMEEIKSTTRVPLGYLP